ncbi:MAG: hypothetical protein R2746_12325 [Acidimicrobiales bacterium]
MENEGVTISQAGCTRRPSVSGDDDQSVDAIADALGAGQHVGLVALVAGADGAAANFADPSEPSTRTEQDQGAEQAREQQQRQLCQRPPPSPAPLPNHGRVTVRGGR